MARPTKPREGKAFMVYALVCPLTLEVKYVGQTDDLYGRSKAHMRPGPRSRGTPVHQWLVSLGHLPPNRIVLERGVNRRVQIQDYRRGSKPRLAGIKTIWLSSALEAKWLKRFRRTVLNRDRVEVVGVDKLLTNPPLPWDQGE